MTATYKGNTIGLNYDAANATWSFTNEPNDFIDPNSFSTADPAFDYTPPPSDDDDQDQDDDFNPCPPGYIYDSTLKQCVIDPNQQTSYRQDTGGGQDQPAVQIAGTNRTTTNNNFQASDEEYKNMSPSEVIENYKQRGFISKNETGNLVIDLNKVSRKGTILDALLGRVSGGGEADASLKKVVDNLIYHGIMDSAMDSNLNPNLLNFYVRPGQTLTAQNLPLSKIASVGKITLPTIAQFEADYYGINKSNVIVPGWGGSIFGTKASVQKFDDFMTNKLNAFKTVAMNAISNYTEDNYLKESGVNEIEKEKARKAKFDADIAKAKAEREMQKTIAEADERERIKNELEALQAKKDKERKDIKIEKDKRDMQETIRKAKKKQQVKEEYKDKGQVTYKSKDTGGYVTIPNKPAAPPGEKGGGGYTKPEPKKYERPGTSGAPGHHW